MMHGVANPGALTPRALRLLLKEAGRFDRERDIAQAYMLHITQPGIKPEAFERYFNRLKREPKDD